MPIVSPQGVLERVSQTDRDDIEARSAPALKNPLWGDTFRAALMRENVLFSALAANVRSGAEPVAGHNPFIHDDLSGYEDYEEAFYDSRSPGDTQFIKDRIDRERENARIVGQSGFFGALSATVAAGVTSPENLVPYGAAFRVGKGSASILKGLAAGAAAGTAAAATAEVALQGTQYTRTAAESWTAIAASSIIPGLIGGFGGFRGRVNESYIRLVDQELKSLGKIVGRELDDITAGEALVKNLPDDYNTMLPTQRENALRNALIKADPEYAKLMKSPGGKIIDRIVAGFARASVSGRLVSRIHSATARIIGMKMANDGLLAKGMGELAETSEGLKKLIDWRNKSSQLSIQQSFQRYSKAAKIDGETVISKDDFNKSLFHAIVDDEVDGNLGVHASAAIGDAAKDIRTTLDEVLEMGEAAGLFTKDESKVFKNYMTTAFDMEKIAELPGSHMGGAGEGAIGFSDFLVNEGLSEGDAKAFVRMLLGSRNSDQIQAIYEPGSFKKISLLIPRKNLSEGGWIDTDIHRILDRYASQTSGQIAMATHWRTFPTARLGNIVNEIKSMQAKVGDDISHAGMEVDLLTETLKDLRAMRSLGFRLDEVSDSLAVRLEELGFDRSRLSRELDGLEAQATTAGALADTKRLAFAQKQLDDLDAQLEKLRAERAKVQAREVSGGGKLGALKVAEAEARRRGVLADLQAKMAKLRGSRPDVLQNLEDVKSVSVGRIDPERMASVREELAATNKEVEGIRANAASKEKGPVVSNAGIVVKTSTTRTVVPNRQAIDSLFKSLQTEASEIRRLEARSAVALEAQKARMDREYIQAISDNPKQARKIRKLQKEDSENVDELIRRVTGQGGMPLDPHHLAWRAERTARKFAVVTKLGKVAISSIPDLAMHVFVNGAGRSMRSFAIILKNSGLKNIMDRDEMVRLTIAGETVSGADRFLKLGDIADPAVRPGPVERTADYALDAFAHLSGMKFWNSRHKAWAALSIQDRIISDLKKLEAGTLGRSGKNSLELAGFNEERAAAVLAQWRAFGGGTEKALGGEFHWSKSQDWEDKATKDFFQAVVLQDVERTILTPGIGELPRFMTKPGWRMLGQFKSFAFTANTKLAASGLQRWDRNVLSGGMGMVGLGMGVYALRQWMSGREISTDPRVWALEGVDRSGIPGIASDLNNMVEKVTRGVIGTRSILGAGPGVTSRYQSRNMLDTLLGPMAGYAEDALQIVGSAFKEGGMTSADARRVRKMIPFSSLFYWEWLWQHAEEKISESAGLE